MYSLTTVIQKNNNNFNLTRLIAALLVIYGHSFTLFYSGKHSDMISQLIYFTNSGGLSLNIFFFLSGLLITSSFENNNAFQFIKHRLFRLLPALFVCTMFTVFIVGPITTSWKLSDYFLNSNTWLYFFNNISIYKISFLLPGVFTSNYYPNIVNGSLWSLSLELKCYVLVLLLGIINVFKRKRYTVIAIMLIYTCTLFNNTSLNRFLFREQFILFLIGCLAYVFRNQIKIDFKIAIVSVILCAINCFFHCYEIIFWIGLAYLVLFFSSIELIRDIKIPGDYSYGIYIYGFLVQQVYAHYCPGAGIANGLIVTFPITILLGVLSWHFVEEKSQKWARLKPAARFLCFRITRQV
jgi:peptidoglycan/LPS O-acetylase OafA/YrhL